MKGPVQWMAANHVASNILMMVFIVGGLIVGRSIQQEVFPEFELDTITVTVAYPGASPIDVEDGIIQPIERAVSGVDNVKRVTASAREGSGTVVLEIIEGSNTDVALNDIKSEVDRILIFPEEAEEPVVSKVTNRRQVMELVVYGDVSERALFEETERIQDDLLAKPNITQVDIIAVRPQEISIEVSEENLQRYNLTLSKVASIVRRASLDLPGGSVKTRGGEVLIRTNEKRTTGSEFDSIAVIVSPHGGRVLLKDIATINDGFAEWDMEARFDQKRAAMVRVYRVGDQTPKDISKTVNEYIEERNLQLPPSMQIAVWKDWSLHLADRFNLLIRNGLLGYLLVIIILALFLEIRLAFFVALGIGISFAGALLFMPAFGVTINMVSLFGFLIVLGVVVDDAIIVGENIFVHYRKGKSLYQAAVDGTTEIMRAVVFAILTSVAAFSPLLFVSGTMGKFLNVIPIIVISVLLISLIESLFILPSHLSGGILQSRTPIWEHIENRRKKFDGVIAWLVNHTYKGTLKWVAHNRYTTIAIAGAVLLITTGFITGGYIKFVFRPIIKADHINVFLTMTPGTPFEETQSVAQKIQRVGMNLSAEYDSARANGKSDLLHTFTQIGSQSFRGSHSRTSISAASNLAQISMLFTPADERAIDLSDFTRKWRKRLGPIPNVEQLTFQSQLIGQANDIDIQLAHDDYDALLVAVRRAKQELSEYAGVADVNDSYSEGKRELKLRLKPEAASLGITETDLASQVRGAFYGAEALRLQRGRDEVKVMVRYPEEARRAMASVENMHLRTPSGGEVPFEQAAFVEESRGYSVIDRADRKRVINVTAKIDNRITNADEVLSEMTDGILKQLVFEYPGLSYDLEGSSRDRRESMGSLFTGFAIALLLIYSLLAVPFRSFTQPFVVMSAIPFGIVGAVIGHMLLGYNLSLISTFGILALTGIVVNDSLVMIDFINRAKDAGTPIRQAVMEAGVRRFRPIILTSLTTFFGLTPMLLETAIQARFLIPMVISLAFGVLFSTVITLVLVPALYLILEDIHSLFRPKSSV